MALTYLKETNQHILDKLQIDLSYIDSSIDLSQYASMTTNRLSAHARNRQESIDLMKTGRYGSWLSDEQFVKESLILEAIRTVMNEKKDKMDKERLVVGSTYYTDVTRYGSLVEGKKAIFMGAKFTGWLPFMESAPVMKASQVLRYGTEDDFRNIYIGMADGRSDALNEISFQHITESSDGALSRIESYCDDRWEGPWAWEMDAPEKLKLMIESREDTKMNHIQGMQRQFTKILREFDEGSMDQFEMVSAAQEMSGQVDSMISNLAKLSSSGIEVMAQAKVAGDEGVIEPLQQALGEPLNSAVTALTDLKAALSNATNDITGGGPSMSMGGDDMKSPMDAMGDDPMDDVAIGGDDEERPMKEL